MVTKETRKFLKGNPADYQLPGDFIEAISTRPETEIREIFNALEQKKLCEIPGCSTTEELWKVQAQARYINELREFFFAEMRR